MSHKRNPTSIPEAYGWRSFFSNVLEWEEYMQKGWLPGRVIERHKYSATVITQKGEIEAVVTGRYRHKATALSEFPVTGDWVMLEESVPTELYSSIHALLPRYTRLSRKAPLEVSQEQVLAANVDICFIVEGLDKEINKARIKRFLTVVRQCNIEPVIVLNKVDVCKDSVEAESSVLEIDAGAKVIFASAKSGRGVEKLKECVSKGMTGVLIGPSGVGKSSLLNALINEEVQVTNEISGATGKGIHTTTWRQLFMLPHGGMIIDTPGIREMQLWIDEDSLSLAFPEIETLAQSCKFRDCRHQVEPDCAVKEAVSTGELSTEQFNEYRKLRAEAEHTTGRKDVFSRLEQKRKSKQISKAIKNWNNEKRKLE